MRLRLLKATVLVCALVISGAFSSIANADNGYRIIGTDELKNWMESAPKPTVVYSLSQVEFEEQRIPGSICIPMELMHDSDALPADKSQALIFYCKGPG